MFPGQATTFMVPLWEFNCARDACSRPTGSGEEPFPLRVGEQKTGVVFELESGGVLQGVLQNQSGRGVAKGDVTLTQRVRVGEKTYRC